jgi:hypothetical protein
MPMATCSWTGLEHVELIIIFHLSTTSFLLYSSTSIDLQSFGPSGHKLAVSFASDQKSHRNNTERSFGVLKLKILSLVHLITLHNCDDIYYLILGSILMHNIMINVWLCNSKVESTPMYNTLAATES